MHENEIHQQFIAYLNKIGVPFRHDRTDKRTTTKLGEPDFAIYEQGRVLFVEFKALGGKLRPEQEKRIWQLRNAGCTVIVCVGQVGLSEAIHEIAMWRYMKLPRDSKPLDCVAVEISSDGHGEGKGKADSR